MRQLKAHRKHYEVWVVDKTAPRKLLFQGCDFETLDEAMAYAERYKIEYPDATLEIAVPKEAS